MSSASKPQTETLFGHPVGLFTLFFAEMWERFSFYGMRALLVLYMVKVFKYQDGDAYTVYGAYTTLVYMTPFFGGMLADRLLGSRRAVVLGGLLMAAGHLMMMFEDAYAFFTALALLICGNGFFKPNISTIVGSLYPERSPKRDGGFTIFYMGINLGAAAAPLLCGYVGETYGWHWGFGLATIGMLTGLATFVVPTRLAQALIGLSALSAAIALFILHPDNVYFTALNVFSGAALLVAGVVALIALNREGLPKEAGAAPDPELLRKPLLGGLSTQMVVYLGTLAVIPVFALLVSGFSLLTSEKTKAVTLISQERVIEPMAKSDNPASRVAAVVLREASKPAGLAMVLSGLIAFGYLGLQTVRLPKIQRERMFVVFALFFFAMLFFAFFEQAGSSISLFTDRNVDRVFQPRELTADDVGKTIRIQPTQEQLGYHNGDQLFTLNVLDDLRSKNEKNPNFEIDWTVAQDNVGMGVADRAAEMPASTFQSINPIFILIFGLAFSALWTYLGSHGREPGTTFKFALGLLQVGLGFAVLWYGAENADSRGMVALKWLLLGYLFHTTGELCLSPVGLSMVTKLSPAHLVSTVMGAWFLATAFSQFLAAIIAQFTGVQESSDSPGAIPVPKETVVVYGDVFGKIAIAAIIAAAICFVMVPVLRAWMHEETIEENAPRMH
jgi:POT family proton-dependent oligopeptide transporter